jgi:hypothetical protein
MSGCQLIISLDYTYYDGISVSRFFAGVSFGIDFTRAKISCPILLISAKFQTWYIMDDYDRRVRAEMKNTASDLPLTQDMPEYSQGFTETLMGRY